jgi:hypothetical protein
MIPTTFGNSPELLLNIVAMRNAEDIARAQRSHQVMTRRVKQSGHRGWIGAIRVWAHRSQHFPRSDAASRRMA